MWKSTEYSIVDGTPVGNEYTSWYYSMMDSFSYWGIRSFLLPSFLGCDFLGTSVDDADRALIDEAKTYSIQTLLYDVSTSQERGYFAVQLGLPILVNDLKALGISSQNTRNATTTR
uniref:Uncharacterized protein n=1 Tax=Caenorhabditis japonica TaxID=281687 RepID=A0A8R1IMS8_CAEJA